MKKMILPVVLCVIALTAISTAMVSCEKENITQPQAVQTAKKPGKGDTQKIMPPVIAITNLSGICKGITCAEPAPFSIYQFNRIRMTKDAYTLANYPATMRYTIYKRTTHISGNLYNIEKIAEFDCSQNAPEYSSSLLQNSTTYYVRITIPSGGSLPAADVIDITTPSPAFAFTSGTSKGQPC